jgi:hypothetical protein
VFVKKHSSIILPNFNINKRGFLGFVVPFIGPAVTIAAAYLGYQTAQSASDMAVQATGEILKEHGKQLAKLATTYVASEILEWSCQSATEYVEKNCVDKSLWFAFDCHAMIAKRITACWGSTAVCMMGIYEAGQNAMPTPKAKP